ncbi:flagellar hook-length control protein FliK [Thiomonas sp.]|uniref:flagellar hook-length control protein FliK n=1 Tax=Thiomonas sp. TaxID=2047785 RepID=UPI002607EF56|nr:flagellar hook-length control protein FliK [Thiomonas sp.]
MLPIQVGGNTSFPARLAPLAGSQSVPLSLPPGARVVAEVVQSQTDGQVLLRLGQTLLAATLPGQHQVGEQLPLIVLSEPGSQPALLLAPQNAAPATQSELSSTAQLLARIQQQPAQTVRAAEPLWPQPDGVASTGLAQALADGVRGSGLFYESHLAAWVQGDLPAQALLQEPQGRLSALAQAQAQAQAQAPQGANAAADAAAQPGANASNAALATPGHAAAAPAPAPGAAAQTGPAPAAAGAANAQAQAGAASVPAAPAPPAHAAASMYASMQAQGTAAAAPSPGAALQAMPAQLQALVQQQLATLAQGAVVWAGQAWPGQDLEWRIEPDDASEQQAGETPQRSWTSVLRLDLPHLGPMVVTLRLDGAGGARQHLRVRVEHGQQEAGAALQSQGLQFRQALEQAGLSLDELALRPLGGSAHG